MKRRLERLDLFEQVVDQFLTAADRNAGNVINRLVRVELRALPSDDPHRIDDVRLDAQKTQFEYLEQTDRTRAHDQGLGLDDFLV